MTRPNLLRGKTLSGFQFLDHAFPDGLATEFIILAQSRISTQHNHQCLGFVWIFGILSGFSRLVPHIGSGDLLQETTKIPIFLRILGGGRGRV